MQVSLVDHPLVAQAVGRLRAETTDRAAFRQAMDDLGMLLIHEATRSLPTEEHEIRTPLTTTVGRRVAEPPLTVPVLRAGLGMLAGALRVLPEAPTAFIGLSRDEETLAPVAYMNSVPDDIEGREVIVLDPMLATGGSLEMACGLLAERNPGRVTAVCALAAPEGVERVAGSGLVHHLVVGAIDDRLDEHGFIVPGLGDAGDRLFGTA